MTDANQFEHFFDEDSSKRCSTDQERQGSLRASLPCQPRDRRGSRRAEDVSPARPAGLPRRVDVPRRQWIKERRVRVALEKTRAGREVQGMIWVDREWALRTLSAGGAPSRPIEVHRRCDPDVVHRRRRLRRAAAALLRRRGHGRGRGTRRPVLGAIERMLFLNVVHGDLSPYNLLVWRVR